MSNRNKIINADHGLILLKENFDQESYLRSDNCYKFVYALNRSITYQFSHIDHVLKEQHYMIFNPYEEHKQLQVEKKKFLIEIDPFFLNKLSFFLNQDKHDLQFASYIQQHTQISKWIDFILEYVYVSDSDEDRSFNLFMENSFTQLTILLIKCSLNSHSNDLSINNYKALSPQLYKVMVAMKESYNHDWSLDNMSRLAQMDKYTFSHIFKEIVGISPYSWLQIYRIQRSQDALKNTNKSIISIALESGFSSITVYNRLFKKLYRVTPSSFRKMMTK